MPEQRPLSNVLGTGVLAGLIAGAAAGAIDAVWSWRAAAQFVPGLGGRLRFVLYTALSHGATGAAVGFVLAAVLLGMSRGTRLGDLMRFAFAHHRAMRESAPHEATIGVSVALVGLPIVAAALYVAYRTTMPYVANRHEMRLVVIVAMAATLGALLVAVPIAFIAARPVEAAIARLVPRAPWLASVWAPFIAAGVLVVVALAVWAKLQWETAKILPLRGPVIVLVGLVLAIAAARPAAYAHGKLAGLAPWPRRAAWLGGAVVLILLVFVTGNSAAVIKAETAYTGLGGAIAKELRKVGDRDGDGYSRFLGGGDCDDADPTVHPGAPEIPDDGIDQNCIGGDAHPQPAVAQVFPPVPPSVPKDFNILVVTIDTTRADHLGMYGYKRPTSPNLDKVAADGTVFDHGWAHAPSTRYSMPAILTGRLPLDVHYDMSLWWPGLAANAKTIAEYLAPLGFVTGAITNYEYFDRKRHMDQGFVEYDNEDARLHSQVAGKGPEETHGSSSKEQTDKAINFVDRHAQERWMLWVHYYDPHSAYEKHPEKSFGTDDEALYDGEIAFTDLHLGRLFDELRAKGLYDKTVVIVTGDHGEGFGEHRVFFHGFDLYAAQTKVPLIIRVPGMPARHAATPAGHVDLIPTLVNLAGGPPDEDMMGRSLVDVLAGKDRPATVFQQLSFENNNEKRGGADATCHVIYNVSPNPSWEVYRVDRDPGEKHDLSGDDDECASTRLAVARWYDLETVPPGAAEALLPARPPIASPLDVDFHDGVTLLALDAPARAKPGETIALTWTFEATGKGPAGWKVFVHVESPTKQVTNGDHTPARPFEWWQRGQTIRYTTNVTLPHVPGTYTVKMGLFHGVDRAHPSSAHAKIDHDEVAAATIEVGS